MMAVRKARRRPPPERTRDQRVAIVICHAVYGHCVCDRALTAAVCTAMEAAARRARLILDLPREADNAEGAP